MPSLDPKFPTTASRQSSSNVNLNNASEEFYNTALNACRSTIAQQGVEIKQLKETQDNRNKRILQLEAQVGHASELFSERASPAELNHGMNKNILQTLVQLVEKLTNYHSVHSNNIVINSCHADKAGTLYIKQNNLAIK